jgi:hypothetical protein
MLAAALSPVLARDGLRWHGNSSGAARGAGARAVDIATVKTPKHVVYSAPWPVGRSISEEFARIAKSVLQKSPDVDAFAVVVEIGVVLLPSFALDVG